MQLSLRRKRIEEKNRRHSDITLHPFLRATKSRQKGLGRNTENNS